jgi:protein-disulfide isomerase
MKTDEQIHKERNWIATIVTIVMLIVAGLFVFRILFYVDAIKTGKTDVFEASSFGAFSTSSDLISNPLSDGEIDVLTTDDPSLGNPSAEMVIVEFADFGCPFCRESSTELRELAASYPDDVYYVYRDFPIVDLHPVAQLAAEAGECAHKQGKFWEYHDKLFQNQDDLDEGELYLLAEQLNLNIVDFRSCLESREMEAEVLEDYEAGVEAGVRGTPTFYINGNRIPGAIPGDILDVMVQTFLADDEL